MTRSNTYPKSLSLSDHKLIRKTLREGHRRKSVSFTVLKLSTPGRESQICIRPGKVFGNAVARNRFKRVVRDIIRQNKDKLPGETAIIIFPRMGANETKYENLTETLLNHFI